MIKRSCVLAALLALVGLVSANAETINAQGGDFPALHEAMKVPVRVEPSAEQLDTTKGQEWQRATLKLSGSMCPACLLELEGKLGRIPGVAFAKIDRHRAEQEPGAPPAVHPLIDAVIIFDGKTTGLKPIKQCIKTEDYKALDISTAPIVPVQ